MTRKSLATERAHTGNPDTDAIWRRIRELVDAINANPFAGGRLITEEDGGRRGSGLSFDGGVARSIPHRLGRKARGFVEVYGTDTPSAQFVGLYATAHPTGYTSDDYVTVTPVNSGTCWLMVF